MQSSAPYLEGDYYATDESKTSEQEPESNSENRENKNSIDEESLHEQLHKTEEEIITLRQVLNVKLKLAQDLKRQLGITAINEMKGDIIQSLNLIKESNTFKTTTGVMKNVKEKTSSTISSASSKLSQKFGMLRSTNTVKSIENKMGSAYSSVKKVPCNYNPGDKIFAKVKGFVYWPARVNPLPEDIAIPPNKIPIFFYGTHEVFFIAPTSCWPYDEKNKSKWGKQRSRAYFNQGIDEIENYSTIYQYGVDPLAEEFLSQFYQFKKSDGQNSVPKNINKVQSNNENEDVDTKNEETKKKQNIEKESKKQIPAKKRNKSGSSVSIKENKSDTKSIAEKEINESGMKDNEKTNQTRKRHLPESDLSVNENNNLENSVLDDEIVPKDQGISLRKRQKSGTELSSASATSKIQKSNDKRRKLKRYSAKDEMKKESLLNTNEQKEYNDDIKLKLDISEIIKGEIILEEANKSEKMTIENNIIVNQAVKTEDTEQHETGPTTRRRLKSSERPTNNSQSMASVATGKNSDTDSKTPSVDSDNLEDEDFRPAPKSRSSPKKTRTSKSISKNVPKKSLVKPKRSSTAVKAVAKRKSNVKIEANDSLSSISSDEKETVIEPLETEPVRKVIDISQIHRDPTDKEKCKPSLLLPINADESEISTVPNIELIKDPIVVSQDDEVCNLEKEVVVNIYKTDILDNTPEIINSADLQDKAPVESLSDPWISISSPLEDLKLTFTNKNRSRKTKSISHSDKDDRADIPDTVMEVIEEPPEFEQKSDIAIINESLEEMEREVAVEDKLKDVELDIKTDDVSQQEPLKLISIKTGSKKSSINIVIESDEDKKSKSASPTKSIENIEKGKKIKENKSSKSPNKKQKQTTSSRKRNRKLSSSSDSDIEITRHEHTHKQQTPKRPRLTERSSESEDNSKPESKSPSKSTADRVQLLHNYNADIRSSLILGHEDYKTCLARFRSLCEMPIDLVSLIKVWQLMDTVKKCRRYKRNEEVKQEAQAVYKRLMDIYSRASKDEINASQALLMQIRHQNNLQNQNVGGDANKSNGSSAGTTGKTSGGSQQILQMPISVADMFQNNRASNNESQTATKSRVANSTVRSSGGEKVTEPVTEDEINEEKMRLLSADLEAKVSDIMNKIEKNVDMNPINQRSLSHLLPATSDDSPIKLPLQWQCVDRVSRNRGRDRDRKMGLGEHQAISDDDLVDIGDIGDDDEEEDVESIVRRIEEVAIRLNGAGGTTSSTGNNSIALGINCDHDDRDNGMVTSDMVMATGTSHHHSTGSSSSALDARIENLINNSFISSSVPINNTGSGKESRQSRKSARASSQQKSHRSGGSSKTHHHSHSNSNNNSNTTNIITSTNSNISAPANSGSPSTKTNQILSTSNINNSGSINTAIQKSEVVSLPTSEPRKSTPPVSTLSPSPSQQLSTSLDGSIEQKDDIEIYDLLGV